MALRDLEHIKRVVEGKKVVRVEMVSFEECGYPHEQELQFELENGVTIALTRLGAQVRNVPIGEVDKPGLLLGR